jgi:endonuclease/exonuclease/phosphatase (EEP) superfamily protein YafD
LLIWLCRLVLVAVAVSVVARAVGGEQKTPLVELAVLTPFFATLAALGLAGAAALRAPGTAALLGLLLAVQIAWLAPAMGFGVRAADVPQASSVGLEGSASRGGGVSVMTVNALTGLADVDAIVRAVREEQVDLLAVVEITPSLAARLTAAGLGGQLGHRRGEPQWGGAGSMLWSRWPLADAPELTGTVFAQPRAVVQLPTGATVTVTVVHTLSPIPGRVQAWRRDVAALERGVGQVVGPQLVIGVRGGAWPGFTWPANKRILPFMRLDHVLATPSSVAVESLSHRTIPGTDHRSLLAIVYVT